MNTMKNNIDMISWPQEEKEKLIKMRTKIDEIDKNLLQILNDRASLVLEIAEIKKKNTVLSDKDSLPVYDPQREQQLLDRLSNENDTINGKLSRADIEAIWFEILAVSRKMQQSL